MLDALSAARDQRESAREKAIRATGRRDEARGRGGKGIEIRRWARAAAIFRHGTKGALAARRPRREYFGTLVKKDLRRDSETDWDLAFSLLLKELVNFRPASKFEFGAGKVGK